MSHKRCTAHNPLKSVIPGEIMRCRDCGGIEADHVTETSATKYLTCPFCGYAEFDAIGLKSHLTHGECEPFEQTAEITRP